MARPVSCSLGPTLKKALSDSLDPTARGKLENKRRQPPSPGLSTIERFPLRQKQSVSTINHKDPAETAIMGSELGVDANSKAELNWTPVSIWWVCWTCVWTAVVALGMTYLVVHRNSTPLRLRGIGLALSAIVLLHLYWISVQLGLLVGPITPGNAEYWIMGTLLPCGIALFHASNNRFVHVAHHQKRYTRTNSRLAGLPYGNTAFEPKGRKGVIDRFRRLDYTTKSLITVGFAMLLQVRKISVRSKKSFFFSYMSTTLVLTWTRSSSPR